MRQLDVPEYQTPSKEFEMITRAAFMALLAMGALSFALPASAQDGRLTIQDKPGDSSGRLQSKITTGKRAAPAVQAGDSAESSGQTMEFSASSRVAPSK